jgi:hypothetical protein
VQACGVDAGGAAAVAWQRVSRRRVAAAGVARAKGARSSGVRGNDSARPEQARVRQQEKRSNCAGQRRTKQRRAGWRRTTHDGVSTGRAQAATELGARGSRVMDIRGRRGKGSGRHGPNTDRPWSSRRRRCEYGVANRKEKLRSEGDDWA